MTYMCDCTMPYVSFLYPNFNEIIFADVLSVMVKLSITKLVKKELECEEVVYKELHKRK